MSNNNESAKKLSAKLFAAYETERAMKWLHGQNKEFAEKYPAGTPQPEQGETYWIIKNLLNIISDLKATSPRDWTPCAEGLPKPRHKGQQRQAYLVSLETGCVSMMFYEFNPNGYLGEGWTDKIIGVIAWRELPEPYNPDRKEDAKSDVVSKWPDWKKRAALSNYELGKED